MPKTEFGNNRDESLENASLPPEGHYVQSYPGRKSDGDKEDEYGGAHTKLDAR